MLSADKRGIAVAKLTNQSAKSVRTEKWTALMIGKGDFTVVYVTENILPRKSKIFRHGVVIKSDFPTDAAAVTTLIGYTAKPIII